MVGDESRGPSVKQLRAHFAALEKSRENELVKSNVINSSSLLGHHTQKKVIGNGPNVRSHRDSISRAALPFRNPFVKKVKSLRLISPDSVMRDAISFIVHPNNSCSNSSGSSIGATNCDPMLSISANAPSDRSIPPVGRFFDSKELLKFTQQCQKCSEPQHCRHPHQPQLRKKTFFTRFLKGEHSLNDWSASEISAAVHELKLLNFSQLLALLQLANASGRTKRLLNPNDSSNRDHATFKETLQALVCQRIISKALNANDSDNNSGRGTDSGSSSVLTASELSLRPRSRSSAAVLTASAECHDNDKERKSTSLHHATDREKQQLGRDMLLAIGLTRRLFNDAKASADLLLISKQIEQHGLWWRLFVPKLTTDEYPKREYKTRLRSNEIHANQTQPLGVSGVLTPELKRQPKSDRLQSSGGFNIGVGNDAKSSNYLMKARSALKPASKAHHQCPQRRFSVDLGEKWGQTSLSLSGVSSAAGVGASVTEADSDLSFGVLRSGENKQKPTAELPSLTLGAGIEAFVHYPSMRMRLLRPPGVPLYTFLADTDVSNIGGYHISTYGANLDIWRFHPETPNFELPHNANSLSACIHELRDKLKMKSDQSRIMMNDKYIAPPPGKSHLAETGPAEHESNGALSEMAVHAGGASSEHNVSSLAGTSWSPRELPLLPPASIEEKDFPSCHLSGGLTTASSNENNPCGGDSGSASSSPEFGCRSYREQSPPGVECD